MNEYTYQTFPRQMYIVTNISTEEITIKDKDSQIILTKIPGNSQGLVFAIGKNITTDGEIKLHLFN